MPYFAAQLDEAAMNPDYELAFWITKRDLREALADYIAENLPDLYETGYHGEEFLDDFISAVHKFSKVDMSEPPSWKEVFVQCWRDATGHDKENSDE